MLTKVGSLVAPGTATGSVSVTGLGFTPKAVIFFGVALSEGAYFSQTPCMIGYATATEQSGVGHSSADTATSAMTRNFDNACISLRNAVNTAYWMRATFTSMDADGFTVNFTNNELGAKPVYFVAIGGAEVQAKIVNWLTPATVPTVTAVTGVGFKPDLVLHTWTPLVTIPSSGTDGYFGFGAMNAQGQQGSSSFCGRSGVTTSNVTRYQQVDECISMADPGEAVFYRAKFKSMDADGFSVDFRVNLSGTAYYTTSLCLKGVGSKIGAFTKITPTATAKQSVRLDFKAKAVLFHGTQDTMDTATKPYPHLVWNFGATDGTNHRAFGCYEFDGGVPDVSSIGYADQAISMGYRDGGVMQAVNRATVALTGTGLDLQWSAADTSNQAELFVAIGDAQRTYPVGVA